MRKREEIPYSGNPNSFEAAKMKVEERVEVRVGFGNGLGLGLKSETA